MAARVNVAAGVAHDEQLLLRTGFEFQACTIHTHDPGYSQLHGMHSFFEMHKLHDMHGPGYSYSFITSKASMRRWMIG